MEASVFHHKRGTSFLQLTLLSTQPPERTPTSILGPVIARGMGVHWSITACPGPDSEKDVLGKCYCMKEDECIL